MLLFPPLKYRKFVEWGAFFLIALAIASFLISYHHSLRQEIIAREMARMETQVALFEKSVQNALIIATQTLNYAHERFVKDPPNTNRSEINQEFHASVRLLDNVTELMITDSKGFGIAASSPVLVGLNVAYRDYFKEIVNNRPARIHLTPPYFSVFNKATISLVKDINATPNAFAGLVIVGLNDQFLGNLLTALNYEKDMQSFLAHENGDVFLASQGTNEYLPLPEGAERAFYEQHFGKNSQTINDTHLFVSRTLFVAPLNLDASLVVGTSRKRSSVLFLWQQNALHYTLLYVCVFIFAALILLVLQQQQKAGDNLRLARGKKRENWLSALKKSTTKLNEAHAFAQMGSFSLNLTTQKCVWSDTLFAIFELSPDYIVPTHKMFMDLVHPLDINKVSDALKKSCENTEPTHLIYRLLMRNGAIKWVEARWRIDTDDNNEKRAEGLLQDISARVESEEKINFLAFYDPLTRLPNRSFLMQQLKALTENSLQNNAAVLCINLDNFQSINDVDGHECGDLILQIIASRLCECVAANDIVARYYGHKFILLLRDLPNDQTPLQYVSQMAKKIRENGAAMITIGESRFRLNLAIGVALYSQNEPKNAHDLIKHADIAMYRVKSDTCDQLSFFTEAMEQELINKSKIEADLKTALADDQFAIYYQVQVDSKDTHIGAEVLLRWNHPTRGFVPPDEFIPLAEASGMIIPLGYWVLDSVCAQIAKWSTDAFMKDLCIAVNVSAIQFRQADFVDNVLSIIKKHQVDPFKIKLELTESIWVDDIQEIVKKMRTLKEHGISFALDDFGTGYSSLAYLKRLPLDQLKIDQSFVRDIMDDTQGAEIARTIILLAQSLGLSVIAEGVEEHEQSSFLNRHGCHAYQGYLYSRPLPLAQFESMMRQEMRQLAKAI